MNYNIYKTKERFTISLIYIKRLVRNQTGRKYSNATAENNNSHIQRVINALYDIVISKDLEQESY